MKAIILAAGQGKRLQPLTNNKPKCMVELFGKSLLEHQIVTLRACNISDIAVVYGHKAETIIFSGLKYYKNPNYDKTNMVETLFCAREELVGTVIVSYGDIIYQKSVLQKLIESNAEMSMIVDKNWKKYWKIRFTNILDDAESMVIDKEGFIQNIGQKVKRIGEICGQYIGLMKFSGNGLELIIDFYDKMKISAKSGHNHLNPKLPFEKSYMTDFIQGLIENGAKIQAVPIENGWLELDTIEDYNLYNKMNSNGKILELYNVNL